MVLSRKLRFPTVTQAEGLLQGEKEGVGERRRRVKWSGLWNHFQKYWAGCGFSQCFMCILGPNLIHNAFCDMHKDLYSWPLWIPWLYWKITIGYNRAGFSSASLVVCAQCTRHIIPSSGQCTSWSRNMTGNLAFLDKVEWECRMQIREKHAGLPYAETAWHEASVPCAAGKGGRNWLYFAFWTSLYTWTVHVQWIGLSPMCTSEIQLIVGSYL